MICLDSDFIITFLKGNEDSTLKMQELMERDENIATTAVNSLEVFVGIVGVDGSSGKRIKQTRDFFEPITIFNLTHTTAERSAYILNTLKKYGKPIGIKDTLIAGIVLENSLTLMTRNIKHFERVPGIILESW